MTYMFILKCALKLVEEIILYYDARSKKHQMHISILPSIDHEEYLVMLHIGDVHLLAKKSPAGVLGCVSSLT